MKTYKFERDYYGSIVVIGSRLIINGEEIQVTSILKVDFTNEIIWFTGIPTAHMEEA